jgi:hypothetical protein
MDDDSPVRQQRSVLLTVLFTLLFGGGAVLFSFLVCGGVAIYALAVIGAVVVTGYLHFLLWGRALSNEVSGEIEEQQTEGELEDDGWNWQEPHWHGRL